MMLITGATGVVGQALCAELTRRGLAFRATSRGRRFSHFETGRLSADTDWRRALRGAEVVVHLAQRQPEGGARADLVAGDNASVAAGLARQAAAAGVLRFVFVSTLAVHGVERPSGRPVLPGDPTAPRDAFARGKLLVEGALRAVAAETGLPLSILRPAPVYGPGGGALQPLIAAVREGRRLPYGAVAARRSYCSIGNLVDALLGAVERPSAAGRVLLVGDAEAVAAPLVIREIAAALGVRPRLLSVPPALLELVMGMSGRGDAVRVLTRPMVADLAETISVLGHAPPITFNEGLRLALSGPVPAR